MKLWKPREEEHEIELLSITPPRTGERTLLGIENLLQTFGVEEAFSLEIAGTADGLQFLVRTRSHEIFRQQLAIHYPQARIGIVPPEEDPLRPGRGRACVHQGPHPGAQGVPAPSHIQRRRYPRPGVGPAPCGDRSVEQPDRRPEDGSEAGAPLPRPVLVGAAPAKVPGAAALVGHAPLVPVPDQTPQGGGHRHDAPAGTARPRTSEPHLAARRGADQGQYSSMSASGPLSSQPYRCSGSGTRALRVSTTRS